jgi:serine protease Do
MKKSPIVSIAKKVCPAVITVVASRFLPEIEEFCFLPFKGEKIAFPKKIKGNHRTKIGGGSGFIVSKDGYVLTCNHVVEDKEADFTVIIDPDHKYPAKVLDKDPLIDMAILKIQGNDFPFLKLGDSDKLELGEEVLAVGNPLGEFEDTISWGIVSGLSRKINACSGFNSNITSLRGLIQTDAAINPGNSGGPLVNMRGEVIGINSAMIMGAENIGFALPINYIKDDLKEVKKEGKIKRPYLGVKYIILNPEISKTNKIDVNYGALIVREMFGEPAVARGSCAENSGLKDYDIILEINKEKINQDNPLADIISKYSIGDMVVLRILREGKEIEVNVNLNEKK